MTVLDNVTLAPRKAMRTPPAEAEAAATRLLERFGLADKRLEYPDRLSGGQQQRVAIVRWPCNPRSCCSTRSPPRSTRSWWPRCSTSCELAASSMTMVIATHEMGFARDIAGRVLFLDEGQVLGKGRRSRSSALRASRGRASSCNASSMRAAWDRSERAGLAAA